MTPPDVARAATADVDVKGKRQGTAVLVDERRLLTARHVIGEDPPHQGVHVRFPPSDEELQVTVLDLGEYHGDLAVLELVDPDRLQTQLPPPLNVWPNDRLPAEVSAYGFPKVEKLSAGVWRSFKVSGSTSSGVRQLRWVEDVGSFVGQSGGPVVDERTGALVGILLAGSDPGRFGRFLPVPEIARVWPSLPRPWCFAGGDRALVTRTAQGQRSRAQGGDLFRGRARALRAVSDWLTNAPRGRPLVITGQPGSGKSAVLGRAALAAERGGGRGLVFLARQAAVLDLLDALAAFVDLPSPRTVDQLVDDLLASSPGDITLMVDGVDEARTFADARLMAETLTELSRLPFFRVVVATRRLAASNRFQPGSLLDRLLVHDARSPNLVDLDVSPYVDSRALAEFSAAMLAQQGAVNPAPAGAAWEVYRHDEGLRMRLAHVIAYRAHPNFLVAGMTALSLSRMEGLLDPDDGDFDPESIPANLTDALDKYYEVLPDDHARRHAKNLLAALAYALGPGISDDRWLSFAAALGYTASRADVDSFRDSPGVDYLIQTDDDAGDHAVRLFHRALIEQLRRNRPERDWSRIFDVLRSDVSAAGGWSHADSYVRTYSAEHAAAARQISVLLQDVEFLKFTDMRTLVSTLRSTEADSHSELATVITQEGPRLQQLTARQRIWLLATSALHAGLVDVRDTLMSGESWALEAVWAHPLSSRYQKLAGDAGPISALVVGRLGANHVVASGGNDGRIHVWSQRGIELFDALEGHSRAVTSLALGVIDGEDVMVSGGADRMVRVWSWDGKPAADRPFAGHTKPVSIVFIAMFENGPAVVSAAAGGEVIVWNPEGYVLRRFAVTQRLLSAGSVSGEPVVFAVGYNGLSQFSLSLGHERGVRIDGGPKTALSAGRIRHTDVVVCGLYDGSVAVWRLDGTPYRAPLPPGGQVQSVSLHRIDATDVIAVLRSDSSLGVWNPRVGLTEPWKGHPRTASVMALGSLGTRDVAACGGDDGVVRIWDGVTLLNPSRSNTQDPIEGLAVAAIDGELTIVTTSGTRTTVWDAEGRVAHLQPPEHDSPVTAVAMGTLPQGSVLLSATKDLKVHVWNPVEASRMTIESGHRRRINLIAVGDQDWPFIVTGSNDRTIRVIDLDGSEKATIAFFGQSARMIKFCVLGGRRSIVVAYADYVVRVWDCGDMTWSHTLPPTGAIATARCTVLSLSGHDVLAFGCADGRIRTWRPGQSRYRVSLQRHEGWIANIAQTTVAGELALVTVGSEGTLRLWLDMERCEVFPLSEPATRMACEGQEIILATGPALSKVKVGEGVPTLTPPRTDEHRTAFSSDQELPFDISTESAPDQALRLTVRSPVANQMRQAKSMARADQHGEAVIRLLPYVASHPPAVCLAADIAFQSNDRSVIDYVLPHVMSTHVRGLVVVQARLLALALLTDRDDLAAACAPTIMQSPHEACAALIEMFDAGNWEDEWRVYERASELPRRTADELELTEVIASLCAARLLAMCRRSAGDDLEEFDRRRSALLERYWQLNATDERRARLAQVLSSYPASPHSGFHALPYQVVSIYHTLEARYPAAAEAHRTRLVREISSVLQAGTARRHQQFAQWAALSGLAAGVMEAWTP